jgi:hypothetical protein
VRRERGRREVEVEGEGEGEGEGGCCVCFDVRWCERRDGVKWLEIGEDPSGKAKVTWMWRF